MWWRACLALVVAMLALSLGSSSTRSGSFWRHYITTQQHTSAYHLLFTSAQAGDSQSLDELARLAQQHKSDYWLCKAAMLNSLPAQLKLIEDSSAQEEQVKWLSMAAENGHAESALALGKLHLRNGDDDKAKQVFAKVAEKSPEAKQYASLLNTQNANSSDYLISNSAQRQQQCVQQLQFVALSATSMLQAQQLKQQFANDERLQGLPICINEVMWLDKQEFSCDMQSERLHCDLTSLANTQYRPNFTHLVLFVEHSKAYVNHGVMVLDEQDNYSVFVHELAHLAGFVDEYEVASVLSSNYCNVENQAPNLLVLQNEADLTQSEKYKHWQKLHNQLEANSKDEPLQLSQSLTCQAHDMLAYKPSNTLTFMEYYDTDNIPPIYVALWRQQLAKSQSYSPIIDNLLPYSKTEQQRAYWLRLMII